MGRTAVALSAAVSIGEKSMALNDHRSKRVMACLRQLNGSLTAADLLKMVWAPFEGELWVAVLRLQFENGPVRLFTPDIGISTSPDERSRDKWRVFRSCTDFEKPEGRAAALCCGSPEMCSTPRISQPKCVLP